MRNKIHLFIVISLVFSFFACSEKPVGLVIGEPAPDFTLVDAKGKSWTLSDLKGQVVFINFWATWCPPCLQEMPSMQKLFNLVPKDKFKMLAVLNNDKMALGQFIATQKHLTMPILDDSKNFVGSKYSLTGLPETFIVDKHGILREKFIGPEQWNAPEHVQMIMSYINQ
ncbi:MAG: TlpA family protein disulfide reductase [Desulfobacterales bacterium]|nr:TlpA family protein disulfide reductase [Desulfobacterales bacterium]